MNGQDRLYQRRWGVFTHFLYGTPSEPERLSGSCDWNARVDGFDAEHLARTLHEIGAGYYFVTVMQGDPHMLGPNATFDRIAGTRPGEYCSRRDLIADLAVALKKYDIDLYLYFTGDGPYKDPQIGGRFGFVEPRERVTEAFVQRWAAVLREYAVRYGNAVKGWWIDGVPEHFHYNDALLSYYYQAVKAGNPEAIVAFNNGVKPNCEKWYSGEDFTAGELTDFEVLPPARFIDGAQAHYLIPLGVSPNGDQNFSWCKPGCKRDAAYLIDYVQRVHEAGGVVTIDIRIEDDGTLDAEQIAQLKQLGAAVPTHG